MQRNVNGFTKGGKKSKLPIEKDGQTVTTQEQYLGVVTDGPVKHELITQQQLKKIHHKKLLRGKNKPENIITSQ